jgi:hypothetical protein
LVRPWKHTYDGIIVNYMVREQILFSYDKNIGHFWVSPIFRRDIKYVPLPQNFTKLCEAIRNTPRKQGGNPTASPNTAVSHLDELVKKHVLIRYPKRCRKCNETLYRLSEYKLAIYLRYIFRLSATSQFPVEDRDTDAPFWYRPYASLLIQKLYIELIRIEKIRPFPPRLQRLVKQPSR